MPFLFFHATRRDADALRLWINNDPDVAWIIKISERENEYDWKAANAIDSLPEQQSALWHVRAGPLTIPSARVDVTDAIVANPFQGWTQVLGHAGATCPWFGSNLPGPYTLTYAEDGGEAPGNLARSEFSWPGDRYRSIGKPAHPEAVKWWQKLRRFLGRSAIQRPLYENLVSEKSPSVFIFPDALVQVQKGRGRDVNPWLPKRDA